MSRRRKPQNPRRRCPAGASSSRPEVAVAQGVRFWGRDEDRISTCPAAASVEELAEVLRGGASEAVDWNVGRMLVVCMRLIPKVPGNAGFLVVAKPSITEGRPNIVSCDLGMGLQALGVIAEGQHVLGADINKVIARAFSKAGVVAGGAIIPLLDAETGKLGCEVLAVVNGKVRAMAHGRGGWRWIRGAGGRMPAQELIELTFAQAARDAGVVGVDGSALAERETSTLDPAPGRAAPQAMGTDGYIYLVEEAGRIVLGIDPHRDLLRFVSELGAFKVAVVATLRRVNEATADARADQVDLSVAGRLQSLKENDGAIPWPAAQGLLREFLAELHDAEESKDEEATIDGVLRVNGWIQAMRYLWAVSDLEFTAACRRFEAAWNELVLTGSSWSA